MRISDERYQRDLRRLQLAWRMIKLGARTPTIERWAALSIYRIRKLRNAYAGDALSKAGLKGVTPFRVEFFAKSATLRSQAPMLAGFLRQFEVLPNPGEIKLEELPSLARGERFCSAYEQFQLCCGDTEISFEHAVLLLNELVRDVEIRLANCSNCGDLVLQDRLSARGPVCAYCLREAHGGMSRHAQQGIDPLRPQPDDETDEIRQGSLF